MTTQEIREKIVASARQDVGRGLEDKLRECPLCHCQAMTNKKMHTGKGMQPHKCSHGRWCSRGNAQLCGDNTSHCPDCSRENWSREHPELDPTKFRPVRRG